MKMFLLVIISALGFQIVEASVTKVRGKDYTCSELQQLLIDQGRLYITSGSHGWGNTYVSRIDMCGQHEPRVAYSISKDKSLCLTGYMCFRVP